jgi:glutamyl-tRNA reductase
VRNATRDGLLTSTAKGVHNLAVSYLRSRLPEHDRARVVVVGLGEIGRRVRGLLEADPRFVALACNRTVKDGEAGSVRPLSEISLLLGEADAAIVCTGAAEPLVRPEHLSSRGGDRPLLLIDLGIPEQIVRNRVPENVEVSGLDELTAVGEGDGRGGCPETDADQLVLNAVLELRRYCDEYNLREMLAGVQQRHRRLITEELPRFVDERFSDLPREVRARLVQDIHGMLSSYTHELMGTVKKAARPFDEVP